MQKILDEYDFEIEEDIVNKLNEKYEYDLDKKLVSTVHSLDKAGKNKKLSDDELDIVNLFLAEEKVSILEFLEIEDYDDEEISVRLGKYAVMELPYNFKELIKEIMPLVEKSKEDFSRFSKKDYDKLTREIKTIEKKYIEELKTNEQKSIYVLNVVNFYINSLNKKNGVETSLDITERYFINKGWKLRRDLDQNMNDIIIKQRENRTEDYEQLWKFRNMYNSKTIDIIIYRKMLLQDLKKMERYYREISMGKNITEVTKGSIINYYTYTLMMMYMASVENSREIVVDIWKGTIELDVEIEKYIKLGAQRAKELLIKNKRYPSPRQLVQKLNMTKGRAEKYGLNLLYLDTLSNGTRNRLLGTDKPKNLKKIVKDSKYERIEQGRKFFNLKQENKMTNEEIAEMCGCNRGLVGLKINEYIKEQYKRMAKNENFNEDDFVKEFGVTKNKLVRIIK